MTHEERIQVAFDRERMDYQREVEFVGGDVIGDVTVVVFDVVGDPEANIFRQRRVAVVRADGHPLFCGIAEQTREATP